MTETAAATLDRLPIHIQSRIRDRVGEVTAAACLSIEKATGPRTPGVRKHNMARALSLRMLKAEGMDEEIQAALDGTVGDLVEDAAEELDDDEAAVVDGISNAAGAGVGIVADFVEKAEKCKCDRGWLKIIRFLVETGVKAAGTAISLAARG